MASTTVAQVQLVLRLTLGLIFLVSAVTKLRDPAAFARGVLEYRVLSRPLAQVYGRLLPFVELGTSLLLLSGIFLVVGTGLAVLMLVSFAVAISINAIRGHSPACHCFGESSASRVGWHTVIRDLVMLIPTIWLFACFAGTHVGNDSWQAYAPILIASSIGLSFVMALSYVLMVSALDILAGVPE